MIKKRLLVLLKDSKKYIVIQVICQWLSLLAQILIVFSIAKISDLALYYEAYRNRVIPYILLILLGIVMRFIMDRIYTRASFYASVDVKKVLRREIFNKLISLGSNYRDYISSSEVVQLSTEGVEQLETYYGKYISQFFYSLLAPVTLFFAIFFISKEAAIVLLAAVPLIPITIVIVMKIAKRLLAKYWDKYASLGDSFLENLNGLTTLKIYGADGYKAVQMDAESEYFRRITMKVLTMQLNSTSVMDITAYGGAAMGMIMALRGYGAGNIDVFGAVFIIFLAAEFFLPMRLLGSYFHIAMNGMAASDKIFALLDIEVEKGNERLVSDDDSVSGLLDKYLPKEEGRSKEEGQSKEDEIDKEQLKFKPVDIIFKDVFYTFDGERDVLSDLSMKLRSGSLTGIIGVSGSGKSTLAGILSGRNRYYEGSIKVNGVELRELSDFERGNIFTSVTESSFLFKGTVRDNLLMACPDADDKKLQGALSKVNLLDELAEKGIGKEDAENVDVLDIKLTEGAANLSGGQRQRLAIARALLADTPVFIFDEATSNIDTNSEKIIMKTVYELAKSKTVLVISHRLSILKDADRNLLLDEGQLIASGRHEELMKSSDRYKDLYQKQTELENYSSSIGASPANVIKLENGVKKAVQSASKDSEKVEVDTYDDYSDDDLYSLNRRSAISIMKKLVVLVKPLIPIMCFAVLLGVIGFIMAIFITVVAAGDIEGGKFNRYFYIILLAMAVLRGILHYGEQYCNHLIAFKLLALIRHKVFAKLRTLAPAKLDGRGKGNLISIITSDIEKLEVFYAHTISPIMIALTISIIMAVFIGQRSILAGFIALLGYYLVGVLIPFINGRKGRKRGMEAGEAFGELNSMVLESLYGLDEIIQFNAGKNRQNMIDWQADKLARKNRELNRLEKNQRSFTNLAIQCISLIVLIVAAWQLGYGAMWEIDYLIVVAAVMSSFGPAVALSNLSNNLSVTLASGERVLRLLEEEPGVEFIDSDVSDGYSFKEMSRLGYDYGDENSSDDEDDDDDRDSEEYDDEDDLTYILDSMPWTPAATEDMVNSVSEVSVNNVSFAYGKENVLKDVSMSFDSGNIVAIHGPSGSGKSTLLKLMMRFWDPVSGKIEIDGDWIETKEAEEAKREEAGETEETGETEDLEGTEDLERADGIEIKEETRDIKNISETALRLMEGYMTQETWVFHDTVRKNIEIGKLGASDEEIEEAAKKASIHNFIMQLPYGYDTQIGELGDTLSDGEKQRIGLAREFLHGSRIMLLDEPTSNLDALNEGIILKSLREELSGRVQKSVSETGMDETSDVNDNERLIILVSHKNSTIGIADTVWETGAAD